jgi:hypothetical protein
MGERGRRFLGLSQVLALAAVWVGPATASSPTKASWARAANAVCRSVNGDVQHLPTLTSAGTAVSDLRAIERITLTADTEIAAIPRPLIERGSIERLLSNQASQRSVAAQIALAVKRNDALGESSHGAQLAKLSRKYNAIAQSLGAAVCADTPTPSG